MLDGIASQPGTYLLVLHAAREASIMVGRLGQVRLARGYYFYVGSAFGPGGVRARVRHHHGISTRPHWHLDYLRPALHLQEIWYSIDSVRWEHSWASCLYYTMQMHVPLAGLGASDCRCQSHFFYMQDKPAQAALMAALQHKNNKVNLVIVDNI